MLCKYVIQIEKQVLASLRAVECFPGRFLWIEWSSEFICHILYETQISFILAFTGFADSRSNIFKLFKLFVNLDRLRGEMEHCCLHCFGHINSIRVLHDKYLSFFTLTRLYICCLLVVTVSWHVCSLMFRCFNTDV